MLAYSGHGPPQAMKASVVNLFIEACAGLPVLDALSVGGVGDCFVGPQARWMLGRWQVREDLVLISFLKLFLLHFLIE